MAYYTMANLPGGIFGGLVMKNILFNFLTKYWLCILLSVILVMGIYLSSRYADLYETGSASDTIRFSLGDLYLIYGIPLYSLIYGCLSYIILKKVWIPQMILYFTTCTYFFGTNLIVYKEVDNWKNILVFSILPVLFSLIGTAITAFVYCIIKSIKNNKKQSTIPRLDQPQQ